MQPIIDNYNQLILTHVNVLLDANDTSLNEMQLNSLGLIKKYTQDLTLAIQTNEALPATEIARFMRHDLLNLLTPVVGYAEMLSDGWIGKLDAEQSEHMKIILYAVHDLLKLIEAEKIALAS